MSRLIARLSSSAALVLAAGLLAGAGPPQEQRSGDGGNVRAPAPLVQVSTPGDLAPDENPLPAAPGAAEPATVTPGRTAQSLTPNLYSYARVLGTDFRPRASTTTYGYDFNGCVNQTGGSDNRFFARLDVPNGAVLKYVRFYFNDTSASDMTLWLSKFTPGQSSTDITSVNSSGSAGYGSTLSAEITEIVDTTTYSYELVVYPPVLTTAHQFCGARVTYYWPSDGHFTAIAPCRLVDTRAPVFPAPLGGGWLPPATVRSYTIAGVCGLPAGVKAVSLNATVTAPAGPGFLTLYPEGGAFPPVSTLNFWGGDTIVNSAIVPLGPTGGISMALGVSGGHVILDINGYYY